jgi:RNA polymerase sigma-70 factor (ECF subfamily)
MTADEYNRCVDLHADNLYRFILKNIRDKDEARDLVQDTFEKMWVKRESVSYEKAKAYMFTTGYHTMIDRLRKKQRQAGMNEVSYESLLSHEQYTGLQEVLHRAINKLPHAQRSVVLLRDYEGYSYEEIGKITGLSEAQVKVYIYRARIFLREYIGSIEKVI